MDDPEKVAAYTRAGREYGVMAPVYLFHCAQVCELVQPGDTVVDLGCGPATQLAMIGRMNPHTRFVGVDLSPDMLDKARSLLTEQALSNVELRTENITELSSFPDASADAVISTMALHHLPDPATLERCFSEVRRVLKPAGALYLVDFGHLKSEKSIRSFAYQYADRQPELFTFDYLYSLHAAFSLEDFKRLAEKHLNGQTKVYSTLLMPFMVAVKRRRDGITPDPVVISQLREAHDNLPSHQRKDLSDLRVFFRMGGLRSPLLR
jgi:arsenite methyltransferase